MKVWVVSIEGHNCDSHVRGVAADAAGAREIAEWYAFKLDYEIVSHEAEHERMVWKLDRDGVNRCRFEDGEWQEIEAIQYELVEAKE